MVKYFLLRVKGNKTEALVVRKIINTNILGTISNPFALKILLEFLKPSCPIDVAKRLGIHEQKVYYYVSKMKKENLLEEKGTEQRHGTVAKFYKVKDDGLVFVINNDGFKAMSSFKPPYNFEPFIKNTKMNTKIIVGSPDPHGPFKTRASDSCCAIDFALFLGSLSTQVTIPNYKLDVEIRDEDLKGNIVSIGGPTVNMITNRLNPKLPIYFNLKKDISVHSKISGKIYTEDEIGIIVIMDNPFDRYGKILVLAGKRFHGTRASVLCLIKYFHEVMEGNKFNKNIIARVVKGYDVDSDGVIDETEILE